MKRLFLGFISLTFIGIVSLGFTQIEKFGIIRAKGNNMKTKTEEIGILIGSPIPFSKDRVRTDTTLVRKHWASKFKDPNQYMAWYKNYKNSAEGIVFMNEKGLMLCKLVIIYLKQM